MGVGLTGGFIELVWWRKIVIVIAIVLVLNKRRKNKLK